MPLLERMHSTTNATGNSRVPTGYGLPLDGEGQIPFGLLPSGEDGGSKHSRLLGELCSMLIVEEPRTTK